MAGPDPAMQDHAIEHLCMLPWMAASEGGHGVMDERRTVFTTHHSPSVMAAQAAIHDKWHRGMASTRLRPFLMLNVAWIPASAGMTLRAGKQRSRPVRGGFLIYVLSDRIRS